MCYTATMVEDDVIRQVSALRERLEALGVVRLALFGSVMRGEAGPGSDIDVLVDIPAPSGLVQLANIRHVIEDAVGRPVDLGTVASLKPQVRASVLAEARYVF
ncbi:MAG: nucleotidyltransferase family protein [Reyranella sp.]|nr:nucleotidyltransferase family protein [Reyranella sp.]